MEEPQSLEETTFDAPQRSQVANRRFKSPEPVGQMMVLAIELGNGKQDNLIIRKGDDAYELASNFVSRNGMDFCVQQFIESQIKLNAQKHQIGLKCDAFKDIERPQTASTPSTQDRTSRGHFTPKGKLSPKPVLQNRVTNGNVHERLYQLRKKFVKSKSQSSSIKAPKAKADPDYNYGQWLYLRGSKIKQATLRANKAKKQQNEAKEMVDYTFKPNINRFSVANSPRSPMTVEEHLIQKGIELKGKKKRLRQQKKEIEGKACTFQPNAERKSRVVNKPWALCIQENLLQAFFKK